MCGVAGIVARGDGRVDPKALGRMVDALDHRGPDGRGHWIDGRTGLGHTRLAIIDLATGEQPISGGGGERLIVNGEIYNHVELRREYDDYPFRTRSDSEVVLPVWRRHGMEVLRHLRGMYAFALHEPDHDRVVLGRDPFGIKPLYIAETPTAFLFASEPRALRASGLVNADIDLSRAAEVLDKQFVTGEATVFANVRRLAPGEVLVLESGEPAAHGRTPWDLWPPGDAGENPIAAFDALFRESVGLHQRADVPYGLFLSGGIDSASVLAMMARLNAAPVRAFSLGFPGTSAADERQAAEATARAVGAEFEAVSYDEDDFLTLLPATVAATDDPLADYAILPTWKLAKRAAQELKVVLSGEGGDEVFAGYGRYREAMAWWRPKRDHRRGLALRRGLLRQEAARAVLELADVPPARRGDSRLQSAQRRDIDGWLPNDLLMKVDRCLMAHGLEGRVPFVDPAIAAFGFALPDRAKVQGRTGKMVLRQWLASRLGGSDPFGRKRGFTVPVGTWVAALPDNVKMLVAQHPLIAELCRPEQVAQALRDGRSALGWRLLYLALWHRQHIEGRSAASVADLLAP